MACGQAVVKRPGRAASPHPQLAWGGSFRNRGAVQGTHKNHSANDSHNDQHAPQTLGERQTAAGAGSK